MTLRPLLMMALVFSLGACTQAGAPPAPAPADAADPAPAPAAAEGVKPKPRAAAIEGSIDFSLRGRTVARNSAGDANSVQCQLDAQASNRSQAQVKSLVAEFRIASAVDGSVIDAEHTLVMPFAVPPGETRDAWGPMVIDNHRCEDLELAIQAPQRGMCRTKDKGPCPVYALAAEGVASAR